MTRSAHNFRSLRSVIGCWLALLGATAASAADIELRAQATAAGAMVRLGDIATIHGADAAVAAELAGIELAPAPGAGRARVLKLRDVQDLLNLAGVSLVQHRFSGASVVHITRPAGGASTAPADRAARSQREQSQARIERAIVKQLQAAADDRLPWRVRVAPTAEQLARVAERTTELAATGGRSPWTGSQSFRIAFETARGAVDFVVAAEVELPEMVVVAKRPFRRGEVIRASDVALEMPADGAAAIGLATHIEDVVGRETTRSIATGQPVEATWVRKPILVRRGEVVTVFANSGPIAVRTQARALEEGGLDDVLSVERLDDRQRYSARVTGVQELRVLVGGSRVAALPRVSFDKPRASQHESLIP